jgi:hypothetical protein
LPHGLFGNRYSVAPFELLCSQGWAKIRVLLAQDPDDPLSHMRL